MPMPMLGRAVGKRLPGAAMRDTAYNWAGGFGKGRGMAPNSQARMQLGRRRTIMGGGGAAGLMAIRKMRGSSGRDGLEPHSMGGTTMM